jgi:hypothetical protein
MPTYSAQPRQHSDPLAPTTIDVYEHTDGPRLIGSYTRDYARMYNAFQAFQRGGQDFALFAPKFDETHVMSLPDCRDIAAETRSKDVVPFCPAEFYVPDAAKAGPFAGQFGFVRGCHWACPWTIQYLDLSQIDRGIITRSDPFGFIDLAPGSKRLEDCIDLHIGVNVLGVRIRCVQELTITRTTDGLTISPG